MTTLRRFHAAIVLVASFIFGLQGCDSSTELQTPPINSQTCGADEILKLRTKELRAKVQDLCARRNTFEPSPKRDW